MEKQNENKEANILKLSVSGFSDDAWNRLNESFLNIIEKVSNKVADTSSIDKNTIDATESIVKDITTITSQWAKAKVEKPSLENEKIKAEIAEKFAQTKKVLKETEKTEEEIKALRIENRHKELSYNLDELERVFNLMQRFQNARLIFSKNNGTPSLFIGANPDEYDSTSEERGMANNEDEVI